MTLYRLPETESKPPVPAPSTLRAVYKRGVELTRPTEPAPVSFRDMPMQAFAEGGDVGYSEEPEDIWDYYPEEKQRNVFDPDVGVWRDTATGNTYSPAQGTWQDPRGFEYVGGQWVPPAQAYDPDTVVNAPQSVEPSLRDSLTGQLQAGTISYPQAEQQWNQYSGASALAQQDVNRQMAADAGLDSYANLRERGIGEGAIRGDLGDTPLGRGLGAVPGAVTQGLGDVAQTIGDRVTFSIPGLGGVGPRVSLSDVASASQREYPYSEQVVNAFGDVGAAAARGTVPGLNALSGGRTEDVGRFAGELTAPRTYLDLGLTAGFGAAGVGAGLRAGESLPRALVRGLAEGLLVDPTQPVPRLGSQTDEALQMFRQGVPGSVTGEPGRTSLRLGGAADLPTPQRFPNLGDLHPDYDSTLTRAGVPDKSLGSPTPDSYLYHATPTDKIDTLRKEGLTPIHELDDMGRAAFAEHARFYKDNYGITLPKNVVYAADNSKILSAVDRDAGDVGGWSIVRFQAGDNRWQIDPEWAASEPGAWFSRQPITAERIEVLSPQGWEPLAGGAVPGLRAPSSEVVSPRSVAGLGDLSRRNISDLRTIAADRGIDLGDATKKADIIAALKAADVPPARIPAGGEPLTGELARGQRAADAIPDSEIDALRTQLRGDLNVSPLAPDQEASIRFLNEGSETMWPELRKEFEGPQWDAWNAWKETLPAGERVARGRDWTDLLDTVFTAPDQATRLELENIGLDKMRAEVSRALLDDAIKAAPTMNVVDFTAKLEQIQDTMARMAVAQAQMSEKLWLEMPGGYKAGSPGARWSRQAADYWVGGANQGIPRERLAAVAGAADNKMSLPQIIAEIANTPRGLMAGGDFSQIGTHMAPLIAAHPERAGNITKAMSVMFDEKAYTDLMEQYRTGSKWSQYDINLHLPATSGVNREGALLPSEKVASLPGYKQTARFSTASLGGARSEEVDRFITKLEGMSKYATDGKLNKEGVQQAQKYARSVESITGRANLGSLQSLDRYLSGVFFSPSYTVSQVQRFAPLLDRPFTPVWNETARNLGAYVAAGASLMGLAAYAGANVSFEPGANFGKITLPDGHHINIWGGQQALARLIYQEATGKSVSESGSTYKADRGALPLAYGVNRLSPQASILLRSVPESVRSQIGDKDLQRALWPAGRADLPGSLYRFATNPSEATRDKALGALGQFFAPLWIQDAVDGYKLDGIKGAAIAGGLNIIGMNDLAYAPTSFTQQTRVYEDVKNTVPFPESFAGLARADKFVDLSSREKELVRQSNPDAFDKLINQGTEDARKRGDEFQKAVDTQTQIRATYAPVIDQIQERLNSGQLDPYTARKAAELADDKMKEELRGVTFPEASAREKSEIQNLITAYNSIYDRTQRTDGTVDWDGRSQLQAAMLADIRERMGPEWADRLQFNVESRLNTNNPAYLQIMDASRPLVSQYNTIPLGPAGNPNRYDARNGWLMENPEFNANLFYLGRVTELRTPESVTTLAQIAPNVQPVVDFYLGFNQKGNVDRAVRDSAANAYFNLPGDVDRQQWRREHPKEDSILWQSGYLPNLVSMQSWQLSGSPR